jgi:hypothetical protein
VVEAAIEGFALSGKSLPQTQTEKLEKHCPQAGAADETVCPTSDRSALVSVTQASPRGCGSDVHAFDEKILDIADC